MNTPKSAPEQKKNGWNARHPLFVAPATIVAAFLLIVALDQIPTNVGLFSEAQWDNGILIDFARSFPLIVTGYFFGALGGMVRVYTAETEVARMDRIFVSAAVGLVSYLAVDSGVLAKVIYPDLPNTLQTSSSWQGIALIAFIMGLFATETIKSGAKRIREIVDGDAKPAITEDN